MRSNRYQSQVGFHQKGKWNYSTQVAEEIQNLLNIKQYLSLREIATAYGKSMQLIFVYLEALASIGMVGISRNGFFVIQERESPNWAPSYNLAYWVKCEMNLAFYLDQGQR